MGKIYRSKLTEQKMLEDKMNAISAGLSSGSSIAPSGSYTQGILGGAASGASVGTAINAGWGTAIGAVVGAGAGAIGTAVNNSKIEEAKKEQEDMKTNWKLQNKLLEQKYKQNQSEISWFTGLRNRFRFK